MFCNRCLRDAERQKETVASVPPDLRRSREPGSTETNEAEIHTENNKATKQQGYGEFLSPCPARIQKQKDNLILTDEQLAVELQVEVSVGWSLLRGGRKVVQSERRLLDVPLGSDSVPPVVVQRDARLHADLQRAVTHVEGENHLSGG